MGLLLSLFLGIGPMLAYAALVYWIDRYEKEPVALLLGLFGWGALFAVGWSLIVETVLGVGLFLVTDSEAAVTLSTGSLFAPVVEEFLKGLAILVVLIAFRLEFDSHLDGIVYGAIIGLGFSATENTLFIYTLGYLEDGWAGLATVSTLRIVLFGFQHAYYTAFTGLGFAASRLSRRRPIQALAPLAGLALAVLTHSFHNSLIPVVGGLRGLALLTAADWMGWGVMVGVIVWALRRERSWILAYLSPEVEQGVLTPAQLEVAASPVRQTAARWQALREGRRRLVARFYQACAELAWKKHVADTLAGEPDLAEAIARLRAEVRALSRQVLVSGWPFGPGRG